MSDEKKQSIGALWEKQGKNGKDYFSGNIKIDGKKILINIFENKYKKTGNHPDYFICESTPYEKESENKPVKNNNENDDGVPF